MINKRLKYCIGVFLLLWFTACGSNDRGAGTDAATYIAEAPDYADATMWYIRENSTADRSADVFYLVSTWETDWTTEDGRVCHYADVHNATHRANMAKEISRIAGYMGEAGDFYSPYYRHITIEGWATLNEDTINNRFRTAFSDVQAAFDTITVSVSPQHHVLVVKGYSGSEYQPILGFLNVGDFHSAEPWLYEECLRENIRARVEAYYDKEGR